MYIDGKWTDEHCKYVIGQDNDGNDIEVDAIRKQSGLWIENGTQLVYDPVVNSPSEKWIAENQPALDFDILKKAKISEITATCQSEINSEFKSSVSGEEHTYGYNKDDQFNFMKQSKIFDLDPNLQQVFWSTKNGIVQLTKVQFNNLILEAAAHEQSIWGKYFILKAKIDAATTPEELEVIVW